MSHEYLGKFYNRLMGLLLFVSTHHTVIVISGTADCENDCTVSRNPSPHFQLLTAFDVGENLLF